MLAHVKIDKLWLLMTSSIDDEFGFGFYWDGAEQLVSVIPLVIQ